MDWQNERYVRLFVRNTTTWRRLGWDGQCLLMHLLRMVDRAGVLDIEDMTPAEGAALHTFAPADVAERGMDKLIQYGVVRHESGRLIFPNYMDAQECVMSDKLRAKMSREKRSASRDVTQALQDEQIRHDESRRVTSNHAASLQPCLPSRADPSVPIQPSAQPMAAAAAELRLVSDELVPDPELAAASKGRLWLMDVMQTLAPDHGGKWRRAYAIIASKPAAERAIAAATLAPEAQKPSVRRMLTPQHIVDHWGLYSRGEKPGPAGASSTPTGRYAGVSAVGKPSDYDPNEVDPW